MWMLGVIVSVAARTGAGVDVNTKLSAVIKAKNERTINVRFILPSFGSSDAQAYVQAPDFCEESAKKN
jgi:hypothetical protein